MNDTANKIFKELASRYDAMSKAEKIAYKEKLTSEDSAKSKTILSFIQWAEEEDSRNRSRMIRKGMKEKRDYDILRVSNYLGISSDDIKKIHYTYEYYVITLNDNTKKAVRKKEVA